MHRQKRTVFPMKNNIPYTAAAITPEMLGEHRNSSEDISVIRWLNPGQCTPEESSYILIKQFLEDEGLFCLEGAYEHGRFWDLVPNNPPLGDDTILGWSYLPFDDRLPNVI